MKEIKLHIKIVFANLNSVVHETLELNLGVNIFNRDHCPCRPNLLTGG